MRVEQDYQKPWLVLEGFAYMQALENSHPHHGGVPDDFLECFHVNIRPFWCNRACYAPQAVPAPTFVHKGIKGLSYMFQVLGRRLCCKSLWDWGDFCRHLCSHVQTCTLINNHKQGETGLLCLWIMRPENKLVRWGSYWVWDILLGAHKGGFQMSYNTQKFNWAIIQGVKLGSFLKDWRKL